MDRHLQRNLQRGHKRDHQGQNRLKLHVFCDTMHRNLNFRILPPPRCTYGELRISLHYSPTVRSRDYKDPIWAIVIYDD